MAPGSLKTVPVRVRPFEARAVRHLTGIQAIKATANPAYAAHLLMASLVVVAKQYAPFLQEAMRRASLGPLEGTHPTWLQEGGRKGG